jgi:malonyl CoA-acyl carrier protein transacylase/acyl carrier protein
MTPGGMFDSSARGAAGRRPCSIRFITNKKAPCPCLLIVGILLKMINMHQQAQFAVNIHAFPPEALASAAAIQPGKAAMFFPGQGAFFAGVLQDSVAHYRAVADLLEVIEAVSMRRFGRSLKAAMWDEHSSAETLLKTDSALLQLAIYAASMASYAILETEGVFADVLVGHSFGEIAALACAGVYTVEQGAEIVCDRVEALELAAPAGGCMAYVSAPPEQVRAMLHAVALAQPATSLTVAVENHHTQTIISGAAADMDALLRHCAAAAIPSGLLHSPYGFHHPDLARASVLFAERLQRYPAARPKQRVYSPILGRYYRGDDAFGELIAHHFVQPVQFSRAVRDLHAQGVSVAIECGALGALSKIIIRILGPGNIKTFPTLEQNVSTAANLRKISSQLTKEISVNARMPSNVVFPEFEAFWNERSPFLMAHIKAEFNDFLSMQKEAQRAPAAHAAAPALVAVVASPTLAVAANTIPRAQLFDELVKIYADAMEYPSDVFSEEVELEADLGIDSVKQTEIISRISHQYKLPPLPANFRSGDIKTMGQIVDFVFAQKG